jgi:hypothetical protein
MAVIKDWQNGKELSPWRELRQRQIDAFIGHAIATETIMPKRKPGRGLRLKKGRETSGEMLLVPWEIFASQNRTRTNPKRAQRKFACFRSKSRANGSPPRIRFAEEPQFDQQRGTQKREGTDGVQQEQRQQSSDSSNHFVIGLLFTHTFHVC